MLDLLGSVHAATIQQFSRSFDAISPRSLPLPCLCIRYVLPNAQLCFPKQWRCTGSATAERSMMSTKRKSAGTYHDRCQEKISIFTVVSHARCACSVKSGQVLCWTWLDTYQGNKKRINYLGSINDKRSLSNIKAPKNNTLSGLQSINLTTSNKVPEISQGRTKVPGEVVKMHLNYKCI